MLTSHLTPIHSHPKQLLHYFLIAISLAIQYQKSLEKKRMMKQLLSPFLILLIFFHLCTKTSGQSPASAPAPSGPPDITALLRKAGKYTTFIGLLKSTQMDVQINSELQKKSDPGFTIFAPTDTAFSNLKPGTLNSFTDQQKAALTQFHVVPSYLSNSQFQTVSNPLRTEAGGDTVEFPLNITTNGTQVSMTTGLVNTTVDDTVYIDGQLAVYEIGEVLLAQGILRPPAPPPLPPKNASPSSNAPSGSISSSGDFSDATCLRYAPTAISYGVAILVALTLWL
eukprot:XP_002280565.2 PREDICTED: fasciclin-like arabinogalactan protein 11 [Vitis vinifera]